MNFEKLYIFCKLETLFNLCFAVNYCFQASCKDLHWKTDFSLPFYAESWKMRKIPFLVTKSGQILNLMSGKVPRPQICGGFHLSESSSDGRNIPLEGGGKTALFPPPPAWLVSIWRTMSQNEKGIQKRNDVCGENSQEIFFFPFPHHIS